MSCVACLRARRTLTHNALLTRPRQTVVCRVRARDTCVCLFPFLLFLSFSFSLSLSLSVPLSLALVLSLQQDAVIKSSEPHEEIELAGRGENNHGRREGTTSNREEG